MVIFFSAVISVLFYWGVMHYVIRKVAWVMQVTMATTAGESLNAAANIFIGQVRVCMTSLAGFSSLQVFVFTFGFVFSPLQRGICQNNVTCHLVRDLTWLVGYKLRKDRKFSPRQLILQNSYNFPYSVVVQNSVKNSRIRISTKIERFVASEDIPKFPSLRKLRKNSSIASRVIGRTRTNTSLSSSGGIPLKIPGSAS